MPGNSAKAQRERPAEIADVENLNPSRTVGLEGVAGNEDADLSSRRDDNQMATSGAAVVATMITPEDA